MKKRKQIIFSFDYELFFGFESGTVQKTLITPTNLLLDCLDSVKAKGNFFVDYLMFENLEKLSDERAKTDLNMLKNQIKDIVRRGHRIELHLHPHWIDAKYNGDGTWDYSNYTHYSLYSLTDEERRRMFKDGTSYLNNLAREIEPDYNICAFRAGGWTIQPFGLLKESFRENGIVIDSSVMYGVCKDNRFSKYDFRDAPDKEIYRFSEDVCKEDKNGDFVEVPITMLSKPFWLRILDRLISDSGEDRKCITDGTHQRNDLPSDPEIKLRLWESRKACAALSARTPVVEFLNMLLSPKRIITFIDHPKDFTMSALKVIKMCMKGGESITYNMIIKNSKNYEV